MTAQSSNSLIRVLIVGVGSIGERHVRCFLATKKTQVSICEPNDALREKIAGTYDVTHAYTSLDDALKQSWDTLVIATPAQLHVAMARQAIASGVKNVFIEKPLSVTSDGVKELQAEADKANVKVGVAYVYRAHPAAAAMRDAIVSGKFGEPVQLSVVSGQNFPFYRPAYASTYYTRHETGGGSIQDALTHLFNLSQWFVGPITRLTALAEHRVLANVTVEDTVNMLAKHGSVSASYSQNQHQAVNDTCVQVVCTKGVCKFQIHRHSWSWATEPGSEWHEEVTNFVTRDDWFIQQCENWLAAVKGERQPDCSLDEAVHTLAINQTALKSAAAQGQWMEL